MKPDFNQISAWKKIKDSQNLKENLKIKAQVLAAIREFLQKEGFLEMDTPTMVTSPDPSPFNEVFESQTVSGERVFFTPSPEFFLKKLLAAGLKNIYQITKAFRDQQEKDPLHLREFTILEWYRSGGDYLDLMKDCESLTGFIQKNLAKEKLFYQGKEIKLSPPWPRISCQEAFEKYANVNLDEFMDIARAGKVCQGKGYQIAGATWEELYHQVFLNEIEPQLLKLPAVILYDYPTPLAALSQIKKSDPRYAERFEFYLGGLEMGNGYSELTDPREQEKRLQADIRTRKAKKMKVFDYDRDFVEALKEGMPKTAGIAVGIDRLVMFFTDSSDIREVTPFAL
jgi:lysyl-tRNA synthetase class 2